MEDEPPKDSLLKPKARKTPVKQTDEERVALAMRMRAINDKKIMDASAKIRKEQEALKATQPQELTPPPPTPTPTPPPPTPTIVRQKKFIKVIEITDDEESDDEPAVIIKKKPKAKPLEEIPAPPARKQRVTKPKEPVKSPVIEMMPRGRFL